jgi:outer membrane protein TolC
MSAGIAAWVCALAVALGLAAAAEAQPAPPPTARGEPIRLTLAEAVALGVRNNRGVRSAHLERIVEKFELRVAEDKFRPRLILGTGVFHERRDGGGGLVGSVTPVVAWQAPTGAVVAFDWSLRADRLERDPSGASALGLTVIQPLLRDAGIDVNAGSIRMARLQERINRLRLEGTLAQTVTQIILGYRALVAADEQVRLSHAALRRSRDLLAVNRALVEAGRMAAMEVVQTEADAAAQELAVIEAENQRDRARLELLNLIAIDPRTDLEPADPLAAQRTEVLLDEAIALALVHRPDYLAQFAAIERAGIDLALARNRRLWDLSVVGRVGASRFDGGDMRETVVGLQLTVPIGDLVAEQAEVRADIGLDTATLRLDEIRQLVELQVRDSVRNADARWRQVEIAGRALKLARRKLEIERDKLQAGRSSNFQVLAFENDLRLAENRHVNAQVQYLNALTLLDQQIGTTTRTWRITVND